MVHKEDLRVQKTKQALNEAFLDLLSEKTFDGITVNELCTRAGVRRATFYKHYTDKYNFLTALIKVLRERFDMTFWKGQEYSTTVEYYVAYAKRLVGFISENSAAVDNIMSSSVSHTIIGLILEQNYNDTKERLQNSVKTGMSLAASVDVVASMCAGGVAATIYNWIVGGRKKNVFALAEEVSSIVRKTIESSQ